MNERDNITNTPKLDLIQVYLEELAVKAALLSKDARDNAVRQENLVIIDTKDLQDQ